MTMVIPMLDKLGSLGPWSLVLLGGALVAIIVGLLKKTLWICIMGLVLGATFILTQPYAVDAMKDGVNNVFDGAIDPMKDNDYSDMIGQDIGTMKPQDDFGNIGK